MSIDIYKDKMLGARLSGIPVLYTPRHIPRADVPRGWYCYDLQGTPRHPDEPSGLVDQTEGYHAGTILSNQRLKKPQTQKKKLVRDEFRLSGIQLTLVEFCSRERIQCPQSPIRHTLRPASVDEAGLFYALSPERDEELGAIGHVRIDFGRGGNSFYHSWWPRGPEELNTQGFKDELTEVMDELRESVLKDLASMRSYCGSHGGVIQEGHPRNYGYVIETDRYRYCLRCNPIEGDYQAYLSCFDKQVQEMNQARQRTAAQEQGTGPRDGPQQLSGLTEKGRQALQDAADPGKAHTYSWYVIENINAPELRVDHDLPLEEAIRLYADLDCEDKRLGVTKDGIAAVDLLIRWEGREWLSDDRLKLDSFKDDLVVADAAAKLQQMLKAAPKQIQQEEQPERSSPLEIRSLADLKRAIKPGAEMVATYHAYHPETVGLVRVVTEVHTNAFYSKIKDQPDHELSTCNHGQGFRTDFEKAGCYQFDGSTVKVLNSRKNDGSVLFEFEVYAPEMKMDAQEETGESPTMTMGGMS